MYVQQEKPSPWCCWVCITAEASISSLPLSAKNHGLTCWQNEWLFSPAAVTESQVQTLLSSFGPLAWNGLNLFCFVLFLSFKNF